MKKPIVFLGPSLPVDVARTLLDADYRPPVRRDDITKAAREKPPLIAVIDGVFMHTLAPSPHEVLRALQAGIPMMGGSSLGALRAVELAPFGMRGVGQIFEWFRDGELEADDEVALVFHGETLRALSEPMVNIRYAIAAALQGGLITEEERDALVRVGKELYFPDRTWKRLFLEARGAVGEDALGRLRELVARGEHDLKGIDARLLLGEAGRFMDRLRAEPTA